jgi:hypothetical protein
MKARTRNAITPLVLLVAAGGAVAYAYFGVFKKDQAEQQKKAASALVFSLDRNEVIAVTIERSAGRGEKVNVVRKGDAWRIASPIDAPADKTAVDAIVGLLAEMQRKAEVSPAAAPPVDLERFGLSKPGVKVELDLEGGRSEKLSIGSVNDFDGSLYVQPTSGAVLLVDGSTRFSLDKGLFDLRDKTVLSFDPAEVVAVRIVSGASSFEIERPHTGGDSAEWKFTSPRKAPADRQKAMALLFDLSSMRASRFVDETGRELGRYGLERPSRIVTLFGGDKKEIGRVELGKEEGDRIYVRSSTSPRVYQVATAALMSVPKTPEELEVSPAKNGAGSEEG